MADGVSVSLLFVLAAAIASFIVGGLWYSPFLFGRIWMKLGGFTEKDKKRPKRMFASYFFMFIGTLVTTYVLGNNLLYSGISSIGQALIYAFFMLFGYIAPIQLGSVLWEVKPFRYYLIIILYYLVSLMITSVIYISWK